MNLSHVSMNRLIRNAISTTLLLTSISGCVGKWPSPSAAGKLGVGGSVANSVPPPLAPFTRSYTDHKSAASASSGLGYNTPVISRGPFGPRIPMTVDSTGMLVPKKSYRL
jgi:hypothetical protein